MPERFFIPAIPAQPSSIDKQKSRNKINIKNLQFLVCFFVF
jgi:hypothetical protein